MPKSKLSTQVVGALERSPEAHLNLDFFECISSLCLCRDHI